MKKIFASLTILSVLIMVAPNIAYAVATTWNSADKNAGITLSNGDLTAEANTTGWHGVRANVSKSTGKWHWEYTIVDGTTEEVIGIALSSATLSGNPADGAGGSVYLYWSDGNKTSGGGTAPAYGASYTTGDRITAEWDADGGTITFFKNGVSQGQAFSGISGTYLPYLISNNTTQKTTANFGATAFTDTPTAGYSGFDSAPAVPVGFGDIILFGDW